MLHTCALLHSSVLEHLQQLMAQMSCCLLAAILTATVLLSGNLTLKAAALQLLPAGGSVDVGSGMSVVKFAQTPGMIDALLRLIVSL